MRRTEFAMSRADALDFLSQQPVIHLAGLGADGGPVLRAVNAVVHDGWLAFHSSPKGEKTEVLGQPVVASAEETVSLIPSTFSDPERACPATTLYRSVQVHGVLEQLEAPELKAGVLQALMEKLQPQGGHVPITADHPHYRAAVKGLLVAGVRLERFTGKAKLAQNRTPEERGRLLASLWARGGAGDARTMELIRAANPDTPTPEFLLGPAGTTLHAHLEARDVEAAVALLAPTYWNDQFTSEELRRAHLHSPAWVGARDASGRLIATARAISDEAKYAWLYDVCVDPGWKGRGVGKALMRLLLQHPRVRGARRVLLGTRDAQAFYASFGFVPRGALPARPYVSTEMVLVR